MRFRLTFICTLIKSFIIFSVEQHTIPHPEQPTKLIEFFTSMPSGQGPFPVLFLLHGYQPPENSLGGKQLVDLHYLDRLNKQGIAAVAISMPGYGKSGGGRDWCGAYSQEAVIAVITYIKNQTFIDPLKMGIYGISRGATLASMVSAYCPNLSLQILESGFYDLALAFKLMPAYLQGIIDSIAQETGNTQEAMVERSAIYHVHEIKSTSLMLHGEFDDRQGLASARVLHTKLVGMGIDSHLIIIPHGLHCLNDNKWEIIIPFLRKQFFNLHGIGINVSSPHPALQISKIHSNTATLNLCISTHYREEDARDVSQAVLLTIHVLELHQ